MAPAKRTIVLISGANAGIGQAVATRLAKEHGYHVIVGARNPASGEEVVAALTAGGFSASSLQLDITSDHSIALAVSQIERDFGVLDVLINNAGILIDYIPGVSDVRHNGRSARELFSDTFNTNVIGTACLTEACLPLLRKAELPRVIFVSSRMGSLAVSNDKESGFYAWDVKAYDASKAAVNMLAINYARILADEGGMVNTVCPGLIKTKLSNHTPMGGTPEMGAQRIIELATAEKGGPTATYSDREGPVPW